MRSNRGAESQNDRDGDDVDLNVLCFPQGNVDVAALIEPYIGSRRIETVLAPYGDRSQARLYLRSSVTTGAL